MPTTESQEFFCAGCLGTIAGEPACIDTDGDSYCQECMYRYISECACCGDLFNWEQRQHFNTCSQEIICGTCRERDYFQCDYCDYYEEQAEAITCPESGSTACQSCASEEFNRCSECGELTSRIYADTWTEEEFCSGCGINHIATEVTEISECEDDSCDCEEAYDGLREMSLLIMCIDCAQRFRLPALDAESVHSTCYALTESSGGRSGALSCCNINTACTIRSYSYKPAPRYKRVSLDLEQRALHFGTEVEVEAVTDAFKAQALILLGSADKEKLFYCKRDSTINKGFEIVTHPFTYSWMKANHESFKPMFDLAPIMRGFESTNCGMHIHMSVAAFTDLQMFKFMRFFSLNRGFIASISRRPAKRLNQWAEFNIPEKKQLITDIRMRRAKYGRGTLNHTGPTIECRIFRSTLAPTAYYGNIEFLQALFDYTKNSNIQDGALMAEPFMEYVYERAKAYTNFITLTQIVRPESVGDMDNADIDWGSV